MFIAISTRDCRAAIGKALAAAEAQIATAREEVRDVSFKALHDGAVHNGLNPSKAQLQEMHDMVDRDLEHMMPRHPLVQTIDVLKNLNTMLDYNKDNEVVIDDQDFHLLAEHLPKAERESEAA